MDRDDAGIDNLLQLSHEERRKLRQLQAVHEDVQAGHVPDDDQVVTFSVIQDYPHLARDIQEIIKTERLLMVEYGKRIAEFSATCMLSALEKKQLSPVDASKLARTFLRVAYGLADGPVPQLDAAHRKQLLDWAFAPETAEGSG